MDDLAFNAPKKPSLVPWIVAAVSAVLAASLLVFGILPERTKRAQLEKQLAELNTEVKTSHSASLEQKNAFASLNAEKDKLSAEVSSAKDALQSALQEKEAAIAELKEAQRDLTETLGTEIAAGDILIQQKRGELVVDVADKLLFDKGQADINEGGQELLSQVAKSIKRLPAKLRFQVGGHTDSQRVTSPELVERYPTNWELSTTRASNVVRYLQEKGKVPGHKLIAAGFSQYRPVSTNKSERGRQKNRRIEITIVMPKE